ncbi:amino acid adenylation domain-containing protein [Massilia sp. W12]|uniref:non-ribosomal peptide synthetase n=1 Tax=Massilia sp. W12 TaxID=3126507 RepID=UPI0030D14EFD
MLSKENVQDIYALSPMQQGMLLHFAMDPASDAYFEQFDFSLQGEIDSPTLQKSIYSLVAKYDVLRTVFSFRKTDLPRQIVLKQRAPEKLALQELDLRAMDEAAAQAALQEFKNAQRAQAFDLSQDALLRFALVRRAGARNHLILCFHHIILDGWCMGMLLRDLFGFYERYANDPDCQIDDRESHPYSGYIRWLEEQDMAAAQNWWRQQLEDYQNETLTPYSDVGPDTAQACGVSGAADGPNAADCEFVLDQDFTRRLQEVARKHQLTVNSLLQSAWGFLLQRYNNLDDVVFGCVIAGRPPGLAGVESMIGMFLNTQPLRVRSQAGDTLLHLAQRVQQQLFAAAAWDFYPLSAVQSLSPLKNRLISHIFTFENLPLQEQLRGLEGGAIQIGAAEMQPTAKYDFHIVVNPGAELRINLVHNPRRFRTEVVETIGRSLRHILWQMTQDMQTPLDQVSLCAQEESRLLLQTFNPPGEPYARDSCLIEQFCIAADKYSDNPAVSGADQGGVLRWTYRELLDEVKAIAQAMRAAGVTAGDVVALQMPRSPWMVAGVLAALYCGATYLPLDMDLAPQRLEFTLRDANAKLFCVLQDAQPEAGLAQDLPRLQLGAAARLARAPQLQPVYAPPQQAAYLMYTSGSTGQPKGCLVSQRNILRLALSNQALPLGPALRVLQICSVAFDVASLEYWGCLLRGGSLHTPLLNQILDPQQLKAVLRDEQINAVWTTTGLFNQLVDADPSLFAPLRTLMVGGDSLSPPHIAKVRAANPHLLVINGYGPTENTTLSTTFAFTRDWPEGPPIGGPIAHSTCHVLDAQGRLLPLGAIGELCCGGDGVALGYLGKPELNAQKFLDDPFNPGGRLYRTGDYARWLPNGLLQLRGRNDHQVKLRGFRIELGEIERHVCQLEGVITAAVVVHENQSGKQLYAFFCATREWTPAEMRQALQASLPSYMTPTWYLQLDKMPLNASGKVDRRSLPLDDCKPAVREHSAPARNQNEQTIATICMQVLSLEQIGIHDNFFDIGANSLNLIAINNRLKEAFARDIPLTALFEHTSIARLAAFLDQDGAAQAARQQAEARELQQAQDALKKTRRLMRALDDED